MGKRGKRMVGNRGTGEKDMFGKKRKGKGLERANG